MQEPPHFHGRMTVFEELRKKHEVIVVTPYHVALLVLAQNHTRKNLIGSLVSGVLALDGTCGGQAVLLREADVMEERPENVVAVAVVILVHRLLVQKNRNATLRSIHGAT